MLDIDLVNAIRNLARRHQFFHWSLSFPEVFKEGGFDVVVGNTPWERIKLQEKEWFASRYLQIADSTNVAMRRKLIDELQNEDPDLFAAFQVDKAKSENESHFIRIGNRFPLCGRGDVNTYAVFAELARQLINRKGRAGIITPTGIATDDTTKYYFQDVMETGSLISLYDFENRNGIFAEVHRSYKFCLLTLRSVLCNDLSCNDVSLRNSNGAIASLRNSSVVARYPKDREASEFVFFAIDVGDLRDANRRFTLSAEDISLLNPNSKTAPVFRSRRDAELSKTIYRHIPVFKADNESEDNKWSAFYLRLIDYSDHSAFFVPWSHSLLWNAHSLNSQPDLLPIYESKLFHAFDHRYATYIQSGDVEPCDAVLKQNPLLSIKTKFLLPTVEFEKILDKHPYSRNWFLAVRELTANTNMRTVIAAALPRLPSFRNTTVTIGLSDIAPAQCLLANLNSFVFDYFARQSLSGNHLSFSFLKQLPVLPAETYVIDRLEFISYRILELTYTAWDMEPFARDCGYTGPPFRWNEDRRFLLRCELDAAYFHLYGIEHNDVEYIMETFPIVKRKDVDKYGEYRTKRVILEIYDEMAIAMRTGVSYQTRLDPPPADVRMAHAMQKSG